MARRRKVNVKPVPFPAPVGGIDDTNAITSMDAKFAIDILNFYPESGSLRVRFGFREHCTGMAADGETLIPYFHPNGTKKLFCATDSGIYDVTNTSAAPTMVKALTQGRCSWTQLTNAAGTYLIVCNGTDAAVFYDGTNWANFVATGTPTNPGDVNGLAPADFSYVTTHKHRLWVAKKNKAEAYFFPIDAIGGTVSPIFLGPDWDQGGYLINMFSYTFDNGMSPDDVIVFQSSRGQLNVYSGDDPTDATLFGLTAKYTVGAPLGDRTIVDLNGDIMLLNIYGVVSTGQIANGGYKLGAYEGTVGGKISKTLNNIALTRSNTPGWELHNCPSFQYLIVQLPALADADPVQYVMNTITGAWTRFDLDAITFVEFDGSIYFTDSANRVLKYEHNLTVDEVPRAGGAGQVIQAGFQQAFSDFGEGGSRKHFKLLKLVFNSATQPGYRYKLLIDYQSGGINSAEVPSAPLASGSLWDVGLWDSALWSAPRQTFQQWDGLSGEGYTASLVVRTATGLDTSLAASQWVMEPGRSL
jgi:hypothetical protein